MISRKTCFILGAGASAPYGYPTGRGLRQWLRNELIGFYDPLEPLDHSDPDARQDDQMRRELQRFSDAYSRTSQDLFIDLFINRRKTEFDWIGRWAIAASIFSHESSRTFGDDIEKPELDWISIWVDKHKCIYIYNYINNSLLYREPTIGGNYDKGFHKHNATKGTGAVSQLGLFKGFREGADGATLF